MQHYISFYHAEVKSTFNQINTPSNLCVIKQFCTRHFWHLTRALIKGKWLSDSYFLCRRKDMLHCTAHQSRFHRQPLRLHIFRFPPGCQVVQVASSLICHCFRYLTNTRLEVCWGQSTLQMKLDSLFAHLSRYQRQWPEKILVCFVHSRCWHLSKSFVCQNSIHLLQSREDLNRRGTNS